MGPISGFLAELSLLFNACISGLVQADSCEGRCGSSKAVWKDLTLAADGPAVCGWEVFSLVGDRGSAVSSMSKRWLLEANVTHVNDGLW